MTRGQYVFCPTGTPHCRLWHNLGSRDWTRGERDPWPALGESDEPRQYHNGAVTFPYPTGHAIANEDCLTEGERFPLAVIPGRDFIGGFDTRCFLSVAVPPAQLRALPDVGNRAVQTLLARVQELLYDDPPGAALLVQELVGPDALVTVVADDAGVIPGSLIAVTDGYGLVVVSGTGNYQQLALQIALGIAPAVNFGRYSTSVLWQLAALDVHRRVDASTIDPSKPIILVGHSYGGAVGCLLASEYRIGRPGREISLLTFGMPKPGDFRLHDILSTVRQVHIVNRGDPVPSLPPSAQDLAGITVLVPADLLRAWFAMIQPESRRLLSALGDLVESTGPSFTFADLWAIVAEIVATGTLPTFVNHTIEEYRARLQLAP